MESNLSQLYKNFKNVKKQLVKRWYRLIALIVQPNIMLTKINHYVIALKYKLNKLFISKKKNIYIYISLSFAKYIQHTVKQPPQWTHRTFLSPKPLPSFCWSLPQPPATMDLISEWISIFFFIKRFLQAAICWEVQEANSVRSELCWMEWGGGWTGVPTLSGNHRSPAVVSYFLKMSTTFNAEHLSYRTWEQLPFYYVLNDKTPV